MEPIIEDDSNITIDTLTRADIALIQSSMNFDISASGGYDLVRERLLRRIIIKLDQYM